ncbi:SDR family oxidoreductase [Bacillus timonensis]|uniref:SDR family oxidoreductase n=1 Tax=Bacillus timonensis TaxID=1033734 RepID=A0A4S3PLA8_9BACI|nr:oxidoreductase [Bacillus timonensis]THE10128.1 SDR family oxidoreductase [Bacillus timonensis]
MDKPIAIITGASSGFGLLSSIEFLKKGFFVVATMRNLQRKENILRHLNNPDLEENLQFCRLDVTDSDSLHTFQTTLQKLGRVDILLNNAGFATGGFAEEISISEYKAQFETNFFGLIQVTKLVLPYMRKQRAGKIMNLSSISGQMGFPAISPYVASKYALEGWSESLQFEVRAFGIDVALIEPGSFQTNIWSSGKKVAEQSMLPTSPYQELMKKIEARLEKNQASYGDPLEVATFIVRLATKPSLTRLRYPVGKGTRFTIILKNALPWKIWEGIVLKILGIDRK